LETVKACIIDFYKKNDKSISMDFNYVVTTTGLSESDVDKALRQLLRTGFIRNPLYANNVPVNFTV